MADISLVAGPQLAQVDPPLVSAVLLAACPSARVIALKLVVALGMLAGMLLSRPLWLSSRSFPAAPVADWLPRIHHPVDAVWFISLLVFLTAIVLLPFRRWPVIGFVLATATLCLFDQTRWQPWVYQYLFLLAALVFVQEKAVPGNAVGRHANPTLNAVLVIVAFTYFYSGLQKCNVSFLTGTAPWFMEPAKRVLPEWIGSLMTRWPQGNAAVEIGIGLGLLLNRVRRVAAMVAIFTHVFVLYTLGPWGHNWNSVVWPWNIAMMAITSIVAFPRIGLGPVALLWGPRRTAFPKIILLFFGILPLLSFVERWDLYLSAALYSGNIPEGTVEVPPGLYEQLPPAVQAECRLRGWDRYEVRLMDWAMAEMNVPDYPAERVFRKLAEALCERIGSDETLTLTVRGPPHITSGQRETEVVEMKGRR